MELVPTCLDALLACTLVIRLNDFCVAVFTARLVAHDYSVIRAFLAFSVELRKGFNNETIAAGFQATPSFFIDSAHHSQQHKSLFGVTTWIFSPESYSWQESHKPM